MPMTKRRFIAGAVGSLVIGLVGAWYWQAHYASRLLSIPVPRWVAGSTNVSYSVAVHRSQLRPWATVWKATLVANREEHFPVWPDPVEVLQGLHGTDSERYRPRP